MTREERERLIEEAHKYASQLEPDAKRADFDWSGCYDFLLKVAAKLHDENLEQTTL